MKVEMTSMTTVVLVAVFIGQALGAAEMANDAANPLQKVLKMLTTMQKDTIKDGEVMHHAFLEFSGMCQKRAEELTQEIKVANSQLEDLKATIDKANDDEGEAESVIEELSGVLSSSETDLKAATKIRAKEVAEFAENQKDLLDTISQMEKATRIIQKGMKGGAAALAQMGRNSRAAQEQETQQERAAALTAALGAIVDASFINSADAASLAGFIQSSESAGDGDSQLDAAVDSYGTKDKGDKDDGGSASILDTLDNLLGKAQTSLNNARMKESKSAGNFLLFKASLERKIAISNKDMATVKKEKAEAGQTRAEAEGELDTVKKDLGEDKKAHGDLHHECMTRAADYEDETKGRDEEVKALQEAMKVLKEMTGDAEDATYDKESLVQVSSFLQVRSRSQSGFMPPTLEAAQMVRRLGKQQKLPFLIQMAHKMESVVRSSAVAGADPFAKVKGMLTTMTNKLVKQMEDELSHKVYCDKEMTDTKKHKDVKEGSAEKLSTKIDTQTSRSMNLKRSVATLQKELLANQKVQKEMDGMRQDERAVFQKQKPELEMGLEGVKKALKVLRDYYSQDEDSESSGGGGAGTGVINLLEVVESDFSKGLSELVAEEESAQSSYEKQTHENQVAKAIKEKEIVGKTKEASGLDKSTSETSTDLDGVQTELDAVKEYYTKIQQECVAKPDSYDERRKRQKQTLQGLQDAAQILGENAALVQGSKNMRGSQRD